MICFNHRNGKGFKAKVGRTASAIIDYVHTHSVSSSVEYSCDKIAKEMKADYGFHAVYMGPLSGPVYEAHTAASLNYDLTNVYKFGHNESEECAKELGLTYPSMNLLRFFDNEPLEVPIVSDQEAIERSIKAYEKPELIPFSEDFINTVMNESRTSIVLFTTNANRDRVTPWYKVFEKKAKEMFNTFESEDDELLFVTSGASFGIQIRLATFVGAEDKDLPALYVVTPLAEGKSEKYKYTGGAVEDLTEDKLNDFIKDFRAGTLTRIYKSQPVPPKEKSTQVMHTLVGQTHNDFVFDKTQDVFVAYMSEHCRTCKELEISLQDLAGLTPEDLIVAQIDVERNEMEGWERPKVPFLKFYPKGNKDGIAYPGGHGQVELMEFLSQNASTFRYRVPE